MHFGHAFSYKLWSVFAFRLSQHRKGKALACGNMTDVVFACGLEIIRIINDSLGIGNKGRRLIEEQ